MCVFVGQTQAVAVVEQATCPHWPSLVAYIHRSLQAPQQLLVMLSVASLHHSYTLSVCLTDSLYVLYLWQVIARLRIPRDSQQHIDIVAMFC